MTVPTARPRSAGGARWAASGTASCGTTLVTPIASEASARSERLGAAAARRSATVAAPRRISMRRRRSSTSPSGTKKNMPEP